MSSSVASTDVRLPRTANALSRGPRSAQGTVPFPHARAAPPVPASAIELGRARRIVTANRAPNPRLAAPKSPGVPVRGANPSAAPLEFRVVNSFPHDAHAYTQGLVFDGTHLLESTGIRGRSSLRRVELSSGKVEKLTPVSNRYFAEGLARVGNRLIQLTWESGVAIEYRADTLAPTGRTFSYDGEGWGLAYDGKNLIHSDGSATLRFRDPDTFEIKRSIVVRDAKGKPVDQLNELEFIGGQIYANVWMDERIVRISPETGRITGWLDLTELQEQLNIPLWEQDAVLNGIAFNPENGHLFVTGKLWPKVFEIELVNSSSPR